MRRQGVEPLQPDLGLGHQRFLGATFGSRISREGSQGLPESQDTIGRVARHEVVEEGGPRAGQPGDEHGAPHGRPPDLGVSLHERPQ